MPKVNSFKDHYGKRGEVGALVYHWIHDNTTGNPELDSTPEQIKAKAKRVTGIYTAGASGTKIILEGASGGVKAKYYVILQEVEKKPNIYGINY